MFLAEHPFARLERAAVKRLRLRITALFRKDGGQIVHAFERIGVLLAQHPLSERQRLLGKRSCLGVFALLSKLDDLGVERMHVICALRCNNGRCGGSENCYQQEISRHASEPRCRHRPLQQCKMRNAEQCARAECLNGGRYAGRHLQVTS